MGNKNGQRGVIMEFKGKKELGITYNKKMVINDIFGIHIHKFRMFEDQEFHLGKI